MGYLISFRPRESSDPSYPLRYGDDDLDVMEEEEGETGEEEAGPQEYEEGEEDEEDEEGEREDKAGDPAPTSRSPSASITLQLMYTAEGYVPEHVIGSIETSSVPGGCAHREGEWMAGSVCPITR